MRLARITVLMLFDKLSIRYFVYSAIPHFTFQVEIKPILISDLDFFNLIVSKSSAVLFAVDSHVYVLMFRISILYFLIYLFGISIIINISHELSKMLYVRLRPFGVN